MRNRLGGLVLAAGLAAVSGAASAAIDVTPVVAEINGAVAPIGLIGAAVLLVIVAIKSYKWVRRAM